MSIISIIVPVYNVAPYIKRCAESLRSQTFFDIEIIFIDDGSTDGSAEICDAYALEDSRIKLSIKQMRGFPVQEMLEFRWQKENLLGL